MVKTHCFLNGNGRHSRIFVNKLAGAIGLEDDTFDWGQNLIRSKTEARAKELYIEALRVADNSGDYEPLIKVAFGDLS
jgi:fido (protein-threonine AMPylation protein)